jgi:hypothetical protein
MQRAQKKPEGAAVPPPGSPAAGADSKRGKRKPRETVSERRPDNQTRDYDCEVNAHLGRILSTNDPAPEAKKEMSHRFRHFQ